MQALAAGRLAEANKPQVFEPVTDFTCGLDDGGKLHIRTRIEVEDQPSWHFRLVGLAVPRVKFDAADLGNRSQSLDTINLQIGLLVVEDGDELQ